MKLRSLSSLAIAFLALSLAGCGYGNAEFSGSIQGEAFNPNGTIIGYVDRSDESKAAKPLVLMMTWVSIDPLRVFDDYSSDRQNALIEEFAKRDALVLAFDSSGDIKAGVTYKTNKALSDWIHIDENKLVKDEKRDIKQDTAQQTLQVNFSKMDLTSSNPSVEGTLEFWYQANYIRASFNAPIQNDPASALIVKNNLKRLASKTNFTQKMARFAK